MFKKCLLAIAVVMFLFGNAINVHAQKIYLFANGDIHDEDIGECVSVNTHNIHMLFFSNIPENKLVVYTAYSDAFPSEWNGPNIDDSYDVKNDILKAIRNCPAGPSDTIVFFWSGHGAYDEGGHYLYLPENRGADAIYRSEIRDALKAKGVRLTVLMTDACHTYHRFPGQRPCATEPPANRIPPIFRSLFFDCSGMVDFNTSKPGQESWCNPSKGGYYIYEFINFITSHIEDNASWKEVLNATDAAYRKTYRDENLIQNYYAWSLGTAGSNNQQLSNSIYHPENGDRIIYVNDTEIIDEAHFRRVIRDADTRIKLTLVDHRSDNLYYLITDLDPKGSTTRLGIYVEDSYLGGVEVTGVMPGTPGNKCRSLINNSSGNSSGSDDQQWSDPAYHPENGDRIIAVNGIDIVDETHFRSVIRDADTRITLTLVDHRSGNLYYMMTDLFPKGSTTRLGIYVEDSYQNGVEVTGVMLGTPGNRCRFRK